MKENRDENDFIIFYVFCQFYPENIIRTQVNPLKTVEMIISNV